MPRQQIKIIIPKEYKDNEAKGLCKVCGKSKEEFEKGRSKYCSQDCSDKYSKCFITWTGLRNKMLEKQKECVKCGSDEVLEVDHIEPVAITDYVFDDDNLQVLCRKCHLVKTKKDLKKIKNHKNSQEEIVKYTDPK